MLILWQKKSPAHFNAGLKGELPGMGMITLKLTETD